MVRTIAASGALVEIVRKRLEVGQDYRSDNGDIQGVIIKMWPVENGSEALVRTQSTGEVVRVFIAGEKRLEKR